VGKAKGKRPLGRQSRWWVDNIKLDLGEIRWVGENWIGLAQYSYKWRTLVNTVMKPWVP
jgi:hypothetical protein